MKNKVLIGLALGGVLGIFDGLTAWFTPEARAGIVGIVFGSCFKGILTGVAAGFFARKVHNLTYGILLGLLVGMALSYGVAAMQGKYYFEIMLPGSILGAIVGFATQRLPKTAATV
jgi:hypothetical protein